MPVFGQDVPLSDGVSVKIDLDQGDGSQELKRALQKDKIDRIMEKYGIRPMDKQNHHRFVLYNIQESDWPILTHHFKSCLAQQGMPHEDFDFGEAQMRFVDMNGVKPVGLSGVVNYDAFVAADKAANPDAYVPKEESTKSDASEVAGLMKTMLGKLSDFHESFESKNDALSKRIDKLEKK